MKFVTSLLSIEFKGACRVGAYLFSPSSSLYLIFCHLQRILLLFLTSCLRASSPTFPHRPVASSHLFRFGDLFYVTGPNLRGLIAWVPLMKLPGVPVTVESLSNAQQ